MKHIRFVFRAAFAAWILGACSTANAEVISGAGSTFVSPVLINWADAYKRESGTIVNYHSVGSSAGIRQIKGKAENFGASDAPLRPEELAGAGLVQFPIVVGGVVPVVNIDGVGPGQLRLTGPVLANIFLGKITRWNDRAIAELNAGLTLPDQPIVLVHRSDGSGTTYVFADYLARVSPEWRERIGVGTSVEFPSGVGGNGNEGVAAFTASIKGAIGYVEYAYVKRLNLAYALVMNLDGNFVTPNRQSFRSAAANADWTKAPAFYILLTGEPGPESWPITGSTFILVHKQQQDPTVAKGMLRFFDWAYRNGTEIADKLDYVAMPPAVVELVERTWTDIKLPDGTAAWTPLTSVQH
jgi:phosphate transport system substrate-binding protein